MARKKNPRKPTGTRKTKPAPSRLFVHSLLASETQSLPCEASRIGDLPPPEESSQPHSPD